MPLFERLYNFAHWLTQNRERGCSVCAAEGLRRVRQKLAVQAAGQMFTPDPTFRKRIQKSIAASRSPRWRRHWLPVFAAAAAVLIASAFLLTQSHRSGERQLISELVDQHVAALASSDPVDVVSTDRHTVKPWFESKNSLHLQPARAAGFSFHPGRRQGGLRQPVARRGTDFSPAPAPDFGLHFPGAGNGRSPWKRGGADRPFF